MRTFVRKVMSLLFNILSRFITAFLPRSKHLLISWLQSPFTSISTRTRKCLLSTYYGAGCIPTRAPGFASHKDFPSDVLLCSFFLWLCFQPSRNLNCAVVWAFFGIAFLWDWNENWPFPVLWPLLSFPDLLAYCLLLSTVKGFSAVSEAEIDVFFWNPLAFLMI